MSILEAIILAIVEGLTEFLPVSSTGHMVLTASLLGIENSPFTQLFEVVLNFGAILSVLFLYYRRFLRSITFYFKLLAAFIPTAVLGLLLDDYIEQVMDSPVVVAINLVLGGIVLLFIDSQFKNANGQEEDITYPKAAMVGLFQAIAMFPGVSRSAASIIGGQFQGLSRKTAAEFSFFLAVPTMAAASAYKALKFYKAGHVIESDQWPVLIIGNIVALLVAIGAIKFFVNYVTRYGFKAFGFYRILAGVAFLAFYFFGSGANAVVTP